MDVFKITHGPSFNYEPEACARFLSGNTDGRLQGRDVSPEGAVCRSRSVCNGQKHLKRICLRKEEKKGLKESSVAFWKVTPAQACFSNRNSSSVEGPCELYVP